MHHGAVSVGGDQRVLHRDDSLGHPGFGSLCLTMTRRAGMTSPLDKNFQVCIISK